MYQAEKGGVANDFKNKFEFVTNRKYKVLALAPFKTSNQFFDAVGGKLIKAMCLP